MKKLAKLKGVKALSNKEQKDINGGLTLPLPNGNQYFGCLYMGPGGNLIIDTPDEDGLCPDGYPPNF